jgi:mono/diheme cytochrome c family protein
MKVAAYVGLGIATTLAASVIGAAVFVGSGIYNIGADDHHTKPVLTIIETLRDRSIGVRAASIVVPRLEDPARVAAGAERYSLLCVGCHLAPGVTKSDLRAGLYPHPPNLAQEDIPDARRTFWTVKHGIKMSAMPAWGKSLDDEMIWDIVAFLRQMPNVSPENYRQLLQAHPPRAGALSTAPLTRLPSDSVSGMSSHCRDGGMGTHPDLTRNSPPSNPRT